MVYYVSDRTEVRKQAPPLSFLASVFDSRSSVKFGSSLQKIEKRIEISSYPDEKTGKRSSRHALLNSIGSGNKHSCRRGSAKVYTSDLLGGRFLARPESPERWGWRRHPPTDHWSWVWGAVETAYSIDRDSVSDHQTWPEVQMD